MVIVVGKVRNLLQCVLIFIADVFVTKTFMFVVSRLVRRQVLLSSYQQVRVSQSPMLQRPCRVGHRPTQKL